MALIPAAVDLVLRLDVRRCRELLGPEWAQTLANLWQGFLLDPNAGTPNRAWFAPVLREADALWLGCRMGVLGCQDFVVVLRGRFEQPLAKYGLGANEGERELGGGWVSYDARTSERVSIARVYSRPPELRVLVSPAEVDSAERSIEGAAGATGLVPRAPGVGSVLVRSQALADSRPRAGRTKGARVGYRRAAARFRGGPARAPGREPLTQRLGARRHGTGNAARQPLDFG